MKPSQLSMLADLSKCSIPYYSELFLVQGLNLYTDVRLGEFFSRELRRVWNLYRNQILHSRRAHRGERTVK